MEFVITIYALMFLITKTKSAILATMDSENPRDCLVKKMNKSEIIVNKRFYSVWKQLAQQVMILEHLK